MFMENLIKSLEYMTIGASLHNAQGIIEYVNPVFCKLFKTSNKVLVSNKLSDDIIDVEFESKFNVFEFLNNNLGNIDNFIIKIKISNEFKIIKVNTLMIKNGVDYYILTFDDITNNMSQIYLYEEIFNNINTGIIILYTKNGEDFYIKDVNPYTEKIDNINKDTILNKKFNGSKQADFILDIVKSVWKTGIKSEKKNIDCSNLVSKPCWRDIYIHKILNGNIILMFEDVTEILESNKKFEQFDKLKTTFLSNMSHEIRTPINSIVGFVDLLSEENSKNKQLEYIDIIKNSTKMLSQLINDILDISKVEEGKLNINKSNFNVSEVMEQLCLINIPPNVKLKKNIPYKNLTILNDEFRFRQIFNNLLTNALKFTEKGYIEVGYKKESDYVIFYVKDTGIGIKNSNKNKIFNRFEKIEQKSKVGYGLGLPISMELCQLMGGEMWFESEYEKGSTFYFKLPYKMNITKKINKSCTNIDNIDLKGKTILIVEDIEFNTKLLKSYLEPYEVNIITAIDGNDALIKYDDNKNKLDLILMDIQIPFMEGTEVTQIIRTIDTKIPIIAQTAFAMKEEMDNIMESGFNDLIKKPIRKEDLIKVISKYI